MKIIIITLLNLIFLSSSFCASSLKDVHLGFGNLTLFTGEIQTSVEGETNSFEFTPYIQAGLRYQLNKSIPELTLLTELILAPRETRDPNISKFTFFTLFSTAYAVNDIKVIGTDYKIPWLDFKLGSGLSITRLSANGGSEELNNGASTDSFPLPYESSYSQNFILTAGIEIAPIEAISLRTDVHIYNAHESESRGSSYIISAHYHLPSEWYKGW